MFPSTNAKTKSNKFLITKESNKMRKRIVITKFIRKTRSNLKINFPENKIAGETI